MYVPEPVFYPLLVSMIMGMFIIFRYFILKMLKDNEKTQVGLRDAIHDLNLILTEFKEDINNRLTTLETEHRMMTHTGEIIKHHNFKKEE